MTFTALFVTTIIITLGVVDFVLVTIGHGDRLSVSRFLQPMRRYPFIIFVFGYIAGHLWGFMTPDCQPCPPENSKTSHDQIKPEEECDDIPPLTKEQFEKLQRKLQMDKDGQWPTGNGGKNGDGLSDPIQVVPRKQESK